MAPALNRWERQSYDALVSASRARERRLVLEAIERAATKPRLVALSPSLARRVFGSSSEKGAQLAGVPIVIDPSLKAFAFKLY